MVCLPPLFSVSQSTYRIMKSSLLLLAAVFAFAGTAMAQSNSLDKAAREARPNQANPEIPIFSTLARGLVDRHNSLVVSAWFGGLTFEGATANAFETTLAIEDPVRDATVTVVNRTGSVVPSQAQVTVAVTGDNQSVVPGSQNFIIFTSNDATAANRTITLSATGAVPGAIYVLVGPATNQLELADSGTAKLTAAWSPGPDDTLTLIFDGTSFLEIGRAAN